MIDTDFELKLKPLNDRVFVGIYDDGSNVITLGGKDFYTIGDDKVSTSIDNKGVAEGKIHRGVRPRWGIVLCDSADGEVRKGEIVLMEKLEWSRGTTYTDPVHGTVKVWSIPVDKIMGKKGIDEISEQDRKKIVKLYPFMEK